MASSNTLSQFCLFCYKTFEHSTKIVERSNDVQKFVRFLSRFVKCRDIEQDTLPDNLYAINVFLKLCTSCKKTIDKFCEIYHNLKLLELQLDLKLNKLVEKIDHANKVPTRWLSLNKILQEVFPNNNERQAECQNRIRSFRQNVVKAGHQRKIHSEPRVVLVKHDKFFQPIITKKNVVEFMPSKGPDISEDSEDEKNDLEDNDNLSENYSTKEPRNRFKNPDVDTRKLRRECKDKVCPECGKQLKSFRGLYVHLEHHKDKSEWKWECGECNNRFATKINLTTHMKTHTGEKSFICRFCGNQYRYKDGLKRHILQNHLNEKGAREQVNARYYKEKERNFEKTRTNPQTILHKYKQKYLLQKKGSTKVLYFQTNKNLKNRQKFVRVDESVNGSTDEIDNGPTFTENYDGIIEMDDDIDDKADSPELEDGFEGLDTPLDVISNTRESPAVAVFKDPQIQIKLEHPSVLNDYPNSLELSSTDNLSQQFNESGNTSKLNDNAPVTIPSTKSEAPPSNQRYSLREKRTSKFTIFCETEADNYDKTYTEFIGEDDSPIESSASEQEVENGNKFVHTTVRKRKILNKEPLDSLTSKPKGLIIKCEICSREFGSFLKKDYHFKKQHDLSRKGERGIFRCKKFECTAYFLSYQQLHFHNDREHKTNRKMRDGNSGVDRKRFICKLCGKGFPGNNSLHTHLEYHKDPSEWKWECGLCGKKSATEYKLKDHMRTHTNEKPYKCRFCKESFRSDYMYKEHLIMEHSDKDDIKAEMRSKRFEVKGAKVFRKGKTGKQRKIIGKVKSRMDRNQVDEKEMAFEESKTIDVKKECIADVLFNELEEIVKGGNDQEYLGDRGDMEIECGDQIDEENKDESGEVDETGKNGETINNVMDGVIIGGVNIFRKGKYFGDGTLEELEDLE